MTDADQAGGGEVEWHRADLSMIAPGVLATGGVLPSGTGDPRGDRPGLRHAPTTSPTRTRRSRATTFSPLADSERGRPAGRLQPGHARVRLLLGAARDLARSRATTRTPTFEVSVDGGEFEPFDRARSPLGRARRGRAPRRLPRLRRVGRDRPLSRSTARARRSSPRPTAPRARTAGTTGPVTFSFTCARRRLRRRDCPDPVTLSGAGAQPVGHGDRHRPGRQLELGQRRPGSTSTSQRRRSPPPPLSPAERVRLVQRRRRHRPLHLQGRALGPRPLRRLATSPGRRSTRPTRPWSPPRAATRSSTGTAIDLAGHSATAQSPPVSIDRTAPSVAITLGRLPGPQASALTGTASDALSGVASVEVTYKRASSNHTVVRQADSITCNASGNCDLDGAAPADRALAGERPGDRRTRATRHPRPRCGC